MSEGGIAMEEKRELLGSRATRLSDVNMLFLSYLAGHEAHEHKFYELEVTLLGDGVQVINGASYSMRRGEVHIIRPGDVHAFQTDSSLKTFLVQFSPKHVTSEMMSELDGADRALITYLSNDECDAFENICNSLDLLKASETFSDSDVASRLIEILLDMFYLSFSSRKKAKVTSHEPQDKMQQILDWMQMHYRTYINADDIAKQFHFNTAYLRRLFKERVGVSIMQYLKELRLEYAKNLLLTTKLKISEVCDRSGYRSMPTFISDFKQKYQHAPLSFREKFAVDNE